MREPNFLNRYFVGNGLDIGGGPDPLGLYIELFPRMKGVKVWDKNDGDAQTLEGVEDEQFNFVHSSHCLEHVDDPTIGLKNWFRALKPGGHLIITVPDEDLYEQGQFPSTWNKDHKFTFTISKSKSWSPKSINILELITFGKYIFADFALSKIILLQQYHIQYRKVQFSIIVIFLDAFT